MKHNKEESPSDLAKRAREIWLAPNPNMNDVESMYQKAINTFWPQRNDKEDDNGDTTQAENNKKRPRPTGLEDWQRLAVEQYCMILCQSGRSKDAEPYLTQLGYVCRLAAPVLNYAETLQQNNSNSSNKNNNKSTRPIACKIWDRFLSPEQLKHLQDVFENPRADYWTAHNYQVEPPSPYFSYIIPLERDDDKCHKAHSVDVKFGCLGEIIAQLHRHLLPHFPSLQNCTAVELWAHNRPHPTGHQFHFDSDNEGRGRMIKNPIMTAILYLSPSSSSSSSTGQEAGGGPSVITNQTLVSRHMASHAVLCPASTAGRMVAFDGTLLHGVIPGAGTHTGARRVTLMLAFWRRIRVRPSDKPGAAMPFPFGGSEDDKNEKDEQWSQLLVRPSKQDKTKCWEQKQTSIHVDPIPLDRVYETLDGKKWTKSMGFPEYDQVYQGF